MDFSAINSINAGQYQSTIDSAKMNNLSKNLSNVKKDSGDEEMMEACKEFEAYMVEHMFKQAMDTIKSVNEQEDSSGYADYAYDMQAQQFGKIVSDQGSFGLAQQLFESMKKNQGVLHVMSDAEKAELTAKQAATGTEGQAVVVQPEQEEDVKVDGVSSTNTAQLNLNTNNL